MLFKTRKAAEYNTKSLMTALEAINKKSSYSEPPKKKKMLEMIGSGVSTTLNIISNTVKTIENCTEMMNKATTQMNEAMYNKLSPEAKAKYDAHMAELHGYSSKDQDK